MKTSKVISILLLIAIVTVLSGLFGCATTSTTSTSLEGWTALDSKNFDQAREKFESCIRSVGENERDFVSCSYGLGLALFNKKQYPEAIASFKKTIDIAQKNNFYPRGIPFEYFFWLGRAYLANGQYQEAIVYLEKATSAEEYSLGGEFNPYKNRRYYWLGVAYYKNAQYQEAVNALKRAIQYQEEVNAQLQSIGFTLQHPATDFYTMLAASHRELKQYADAIAAAKMSIEIEPNDSAYGVSGDIYSDQKQYNDAIDAYKKAINLDPQDISYYFQLSNIYSEKEDYASAIAINQKAQALAPENADIPFAIASFYMYMGKFDEAISSLNKAISLSTITGVGLDIFVEENYPVVKSVMEGPAKRAGIEAGDRIVKINGQPTKGWDGGKVAQNIKGAEGTQITLTIERKGVDKPFEKTITRETVISKAAAAPLALRSLVYREKGRLEESYKDAEKAYSLDPTNDSAKKSLGAVYIAQGKYDDAIKMLSTTQKDDSFARILEAITYAKSGNTKKAVEIYSSIPADYLVSKNALHQSYKKALLESLKSYARARKDSAKSLEAKGQYREALKEYAGLVKIADDNEAKEIINDIAKLIKKNPYLAELPEEARRHVMRAEVLTKEGKFEDAVKEYKEAIKIAPFFPVLYKAIALNYAELKQYRQAINNLNTYLDLSPDAPDVRAAKDEIYKWELMMEKEGR